MPAPIFYSGIQRTLPAVEPNSYNYSYGVFDLPGSAAAHTFMTIFNPANSGRVIYGGGITIQNYTTGITTVDKSMLMRPILAHTGGTLATDLIKGDVFGPNPVMEVRVGNPGVTLASTAILAGASPPIAGGGASSATFFQFDAPYGRVQLPPGGGAAFQTDGGDVDQRWSIFAFWTEFVTI